MCRYAFKTYKTHFACFSCRKTFKQAPYRDLLQQVGKADYYEKLNRKPIKLLTDQERSQLAGIEKHYKEREIKCPECGNYMADLGLDLKSPKKTAVKEWKIIEGLYKIGINFHSCGCYGIGYIPKNPKKYEEYLNNILHDYENSILYYQKQTHEECKDKAERIKYWSERTEAIKAELTRQKFALDTPH
jgi:hypothetical protein